MCEGVRRSADHHHRLGRFDPGGRAQDCGAAQGMADQDFGGLEVLLHELGRRHQVLDVRGEIGFGKVALALPQAREVEPQDGQAPVGQGAADVADRLQVLGAGETMGEQGVGLGFPVGRKVHSSRYLDSVRVLERNSFVFHTLVYFPYFVLSVSVFILEAVVSKPAVFIEIR